MNKLIYLYRILVGLPLGGLISSVGLPSELLGRTVTFVPSDNVFVLIPLPLSTPDPPGKLSKSSLSPKAIAKGDTYF